MTRRGSRATVRGDGYALSWEEGPAGITRAPFFELEDDGGALWMRLSAFSGIHTRGIRDETMGVAEPVVQRTPDAVIITVDTESPAWRRRALELRCTSDTIELTVLAEGEGVITDVTLLGGDGIVPTGAAGTFRSGIEAQSLYVPTPTEPVAFIRAASAPASLGVVGDAEPGRLHGIFSPPPLALAFGRGGPIDPFRATEAPWLAAWLRAPVTDLRFTSLRYEPLDGGALLRLAYEGHTRVDGSWRSPTLVLATVAAPLDALHRYRADLIARDMAMDDAPPLQPWWLEPIFCGWGAQYARSRTGAAELCRQDVYDGFLAALDVATLDPGTIVIDDRWQAQYGTAEPDVDAWPDLRGWIADRHREGRRVLLWWKAWDPAGLPPEECITDAAGRPVAADPGSRAYLRRLDAIVARLLGPDGLDADGFKVDFTQRSPSGETLQSAPRSDGVWGIAALHRLIERIHLAGRRIKPDALVITHTVHPSFGDVTDMIRTNDVLERDTGGARVSVAAQLRARHEIVAATMPRHLVDTDQWPMPSRAEWLDYARAQGLLGIPALYYIDSVTTEPILPEHLAVIGETWAAYREARG